MRRSRPTSSTVLNVLSRERILSPNPSCSGDLLDEMNNGFSFSSLASNNVVNRRAEDTDSFLPSSEPVPRSSKAKRSTSKSGFSTFSSAPLRDFALRHRRSHVTLLIWHSACVVIAMCRTMADRRCVFPTPLRPQANSPCVGWRLSSNSTNEGGKFPNLACRYSDGTSLMHFRIRSTKLCRRRRRTAY